MNSFSRTPQFFRALFFSLGIFLLIAIVIYPHTSDAQSNPEAALPSEADTQVTWLEPRGLSIVDMLSGGLDPTMFTNAPISWTPSGGLVQYLSGSVSGSQITINTRMLPTAVKAPQCLGQPPFNDQWPIVVPESKVIIKSNGVDVTDQVFRIDYYPGGQIHPRTGSKEGVSRYDLEIIATGDLVYDNGKLVIPANMGCYITMNSSFTNLTMESVFVTPSYINLDILGSRDKTFDSYYWPAPQGTGNLTSLNTQMSNKYAFGDQGNHDFTRLEPPDGTEYVVMVFPPVTIDPFVPKIENNGLNLNNIKPFHGSGTYRIRNAEPPFELTSVDHTVLAGLPLHGQTVDSDFAQTSDFLPFFKVAKYRMHALEALVLTHHYDPCMSNGGCSDSLLESIRDSTMDVKIYYLKSTRILPTGLTQLTVKQTGESWTTRASDTAVVETAVSDVTPAIQLDTAATSFLYLPLIFKPVPIPDDDPTANCPCGWFTDDGRMLDFVESN